MSGSAPSAWRPEFFRTGLARTAFASVAETAVRLALETDWPSPERLSELAAALGITNSAGRPLRFVPQTVPCGQRDYEAGILASGAVPTRPRSWHDLLNALVWLSLPAAKAALNLLQCTVLADAAGGRRPPMADAATLFDESGLLLLGPDPGLFDLLRARRWREALWSRRDDWAHARAYVVGHAVLEKALAPYPEITAKCLVLTLPPGAPVPPPGPAPAWLDSWLAERWLGGHIQRPSDLFPLPILGIPGWWPDNRQAAFYDQERVFRPQGRTLPERR